MARFSDPKQAASPRYMREAPIVMMTTESQNVNQRNVHESYATDELTCKDLEHLASKLAVSFYELLRI